MSQPRRRSAFRALVWTAYVLALLGLAEAATRVLELVPPITPQPEIAITLHYDDPNGLVRMRPGARYTTAGDVPMIINGDGLRDREYARTPPPGVTRIAVVGDSFTMGDGVVVEESYPDQLEAQLAAREGGPPIEVINFGISATNTLQQLEIVRTTALGYQPDVVVLGFNLNDYTVYTRTSFERMTDRYGLTYRVQPDETVQVVFPSRTWAEHVKNAITTRLALVRLALVAWERASGDDAAPEAAPRVHDMLNGQVPPDEASRVHQAIRDMRDLVESAGARFVVLIIPAMTEVPRPHPATFAGYPFTALHRRLGEVLDAAGIAWLDVLAAFDDRPVASLAASRFDPHFNREGNEIIARELQEFLIAHGIIR